ncbi:hypothetical protein A2U01_0044967, partial [Trifolium medium]|nr:hypothetical protein [Trifolium medium]
KLSVSSTESGHHNALELDDVSKVLLGFAFSVLIA